MASPEDYAPFFRAVIQQLNLAGIPLQRRGNNYATTGGSVHLSVGFEDAERRGRGGGLHVGVFFQKSAQDPEVAQERNNRLLDEFREALPNLEQLVDESLIPDYHRPGVKRSSLVALRGEFTIEQVASDPVVARNAEAWALTTATRWWETCEQTVREMRRRRS